MWRTVAQRVEQIDDRGVALLGFDLLQHPGHLVPKEHDAIVRQLRQFVEAAEQNIAPMRFRRRRDADAADLHSGNRADDMAGAGLEARALFRNGVLPIGER